MNSPEFLHSFYRIHPVLFGQIKPCGQILLPWKVHVIDKFRNRDVRLGPCNVENAVYHLSRSRTEAVARLQWLQR